MGTIQNLLLQPSSFAGYAMLFQTLPVLIATPSSPVAWGGTFAALAAILRTDNSGK